MQENRVVATNQLGRKIVFFSKLYLNGIVEHLTFFLGQIYCFCCTNVFGILLFWCINAYAAFCYDDLCIFFLDKSYSHMGIEWIGGKGFCGFVVVCQCKCNIVCKWCKWGVYCGCNNILWLLNVVVPALISSCFVFSLRVFRTKNIK